MEMLGAEFGISSMNPCIKPALSEQFRLVLMLVVMMWGMFSWHTLGPLIPIEHPLYAKAYLSIVDHFDTFMVPILQYLPTFSITLSQSTSHLGLLPRTWQWVKCISVASSVTRSESRSEHFGDVIRSMNCAVVIIIWRNHVSMDHNLKGKFSTPCANHASTLFLIKWYIT